MLASLPGKFFPGLDLIHDRLAFNLKYIVVEYALSVKMPFWWSYVPDAGTVEGAGKYGDGPCVVYDPETFDPVW